MKLSLGHSNQLSTIELSAFLSAWLTGVLNLMPFSAILFIIFLSIFDISLCGDRDKPALITYPDVALNYVSCFQGLLFCPEAASLMLRNFCIYHIDAPGHELGADVISSDEPLLCVDDLADQVAEVLDFFGLREVMCMGVTAGAYILTLFAMKYKERVLGLILVSPICKGPSWTEWIYNKVSSQPSCFYHKLSFEIEIPTTISRKVVMCQTIYRVCLKIIVSTVTLRRDLSEGLKNLQCKTLIFAGESSPFHAESIHMSTKMDSKICALVEHVVVSFLSTTAPNLLDDTESKGRKRMHVERFSDKKKIAFTRDSLSQVLYYDEFVKELVPGHRKMAIILAASSAVLALLLVTATMGFFIRKNVMRKRRERKQFGTLLDTVNKSKLNVPYEILEKATNYFNDDNKLGQGGSGSVYKGVMPDGNTVAVKRLSFNSTQWVDHFFNEVNLISGVHHKNDERRKNTYTSESLRQRFNRDSGMHS
ncbi:hypothetical protein RYX36_004980 [Vicia faba]